MIMGRPPHDSLSAGLHRRHSPRGCGPACAPRPEPRRFVPQQLLDRLHQHPLRSAPGADRPQATRLESGSKPSAATRQAVPPPDRGEETDAHASRRAHERCLRGSAPPCAVLRAISRKAADDFAETVYPAGSAFRRPARAPPSRQFSRSSLAPALCAYNPPHERPDDGLSRSRCRRSSAAPKRSIRAARSSRACADKSIHRYTYGDFAVRARRLARALLDLGIRPGDRVATLGWNHGPHLEAYFGIPLMGGVLHTLNLRLHPDELAYIVNHAEDRAVLVDETPAAAVGTGAAAASTCRSTIVVGATEAGARRLSRIRSAARAGRAGAGSRRTPTSATPPRCATRPARPATPKGVALLAPRARAAHARPLARSLHGHPRARHRAAGRADVPRQRVGHAVRRGDGRREAGDARPAPRSREPRRSVPARARHDRPAACRRSGWACCSTSTRTPASSTSRRIRAMYVGGSAVPQALIEAFEKRYGLTIFQAWGMTEMAPLGTVAHTARRRSTARRRGAVPATARSRGGRRRSSKSARATRTASSPWDGKTMGELEVRGPWIASAYYNRADCGDRFTDDGWFKTGDIVTIDERRDDPDPGSTKDLIKSGGEWISSVALECALMGHPAVAEAAVIPVTHPKWSERPLAAVVLKPGATATPAELRGVPRAAVSEVLAARRVRVHRRHPAHVGRKVQEKRAARAVQGLPAAE